LATIIKRYIKHVHDTSEFSAELLIACIDGDANVFQEEIVAKVNGAVGGSITSSFIH
jgi:hypothetical protein